MTEFLIITYFVGVLFSYGSARESKVMPGWAALSVALVWPLLAAVMVGEQSAKEAREVDEREP